MDLQQIGYFLYMEEQEKQQEQQKVNAENFLDLVGEQTTTNEEEERKKFFS